MAWRNQGITGSNNIPLGKRRFAGDDEEGGSVQAESNDGFSNGPDRDLKRGRSPEPSKYRNSPFSTALYMIDCVLGTDADGPRRRKKRNRWGDASENKAAGLMGLPTAIVANMTSEQLEAYTLHLRIEEISQKLKIDDVVPADGDRQAPPPVPSVPTPYVTNLTTSRSPSPAPQYDNHGRRVNTREYRYRKRLEDERHKLIEKAMKTIPNYHPPQDYRRPTKTQEKVYVPVNDYPEINFSMITNPLTSLTISLAPTVWRLSTAALFRRLVSLIESCSLTCLLITILTLSPPRIKLAYSSVLVATH